MIQAACACRRASTDLCLENIERSERDGCRVVVDRLGIGGRDSGGEREEEGPEAHQCCDLGMRLLPCDSYRGPKSQRVAIEAVCLQHP